MLKLMPNISKKELEVITGESNMEEYKSYPLKSSANISSSLSTFLCRLTLSTMPIAMNNVSKDVIPQLKKGNGTPVLGSIHETTPILINV